MAGEETERFHDLALNVQSLTDRLKQIATDVHDIREHQTEFSKSQHAEAVRAAAASVERKHVNSRLENIEREMSVLSDLIRSGSKPNVKAPLTIAAGSAGGVVGIIELIKAILSSYER